MIDRQKKELRPKFKNDKFLILVLAIVIVILFGFITFILLGKNILNKKEKIAETYVQKNINSCSEIRYNFTAFTPNDFSLNSEVYFGTIGYTYNSLPWLNDREFTDVNPIRRQAGYTLVSNDCGRTWYGGQEYIPPMKIEGKVDDIANGVNHFDTELEANFFSQGVISHMRWGDNAVNMTSKIYPVFPSSSQNKWIYQELVNKKEPYPIIGNPDPEYRDVFYSPSIVLNKDDSEKSVNIYFGGWRYRINKPIPECNNPERSASEYVNGYKEKICNCSEYNNLGWPIDSCTGDKIFVATNKFAGQNKLIYKVYKGVSSWTENAWDSADFEPIIYPSLLNENCAKDNCPFPFIHINDPSVIETNGKYRYVMYFTGGVYDSSVGKMVAYTHVATSPDGLNWENYRILSKADNVKFPGGLRYNSANGTVRAYFDEINNKIILLSVPVPSIHDHPAIPIGHPDAWKLFIYELDVNNPFVVKDVRKADKFNHQLANCEYQPAVCVESFSYY